MAKLSGQKIAGLWLLIAPTALLVVTILLFAILNWTFLGAQGTSPMSCANPNADFSSSTGVSYSQDEDCAVDRLFGDQPLGTTIANVALYIIGIIAGVAWLPGIIIGIVLLATARK